MINKRISHDKLVIGAYILQPYAQTEAHIKDLAECGVELVVCLCPKDRSVLDLLHKYGVGCILSGYLPTWWGGDGSNAGTMSEKYPLDLYEKLSKEFEDHPAVWGLDICDEPSAFEFEYLSKLARFIEDAFPNQFPYINLYPNYAAVSKNTEDETKCQLGTATYEEHIEKYIEKVDLPYISYDYYLYPQTKNHHVGKMLDNFRIVSDACRRTGKDFWYIPMVNGRSENDFTSLNMLRYQAYIALAYGATVINWACYTGGWWFNNVLDTKGNKTEQYDKLKTMNAELRAIGDTYMKYKTVSTHLLGFGEDWKDECSKVITKNSLDCGFARDLRSDGKLVIGQMIHRENNDKNALFICNASDPCDTDNSVATVSFRSYERCVTVHSGCEKIDLSQNGDEYSFKIKSSHGVMITFE